MRSFLFQLLNESIRLRVRAPIFNCVSLLIEICIEYTQSYIELCDFLDLFGQVFHVIFFFFGGDEVVPVI